MPLREFPRPPALDAHRVWLPDTEVDWRNLRDVLDWRYDLELTQVVASQDTIDLLEKERGNELEVARGSQMDWQKVRDKIARQGMRNSNVLAIAPTDLFLERHDTANESGHMGNQPPTVNTADDDLAGCLAVRPGN